MKKVTGTIFNVRDLVVGGNTIHVFSMNKKSENGMRFGGHGSRTFEAVFVTQQPSGNGEPSDVALQLACMPDEALAEVTVEDIEGELPCGWEADPKRRLKVVEIKVIPPSSRGA